jgi:uncharacterized membrane protein YebE (DUF533 family)
MPNVPEHEALACLKVLVAVMRADGKIEPSERASLAGAIAGFEMGDLVTVDSLLDAEIDVDAELAHIASAEGRAQTYRSASFMVSADGRKNAAELALLERIAAATETGSSDRASVDGLFAAQPKSRLGTFADAIGNLFRKKS